MKQGQCHRVHKTSVKAYLAGITPSAPIAAINLRQFIFLSKELRYGGLGMEKQHPADRMGSRPSDQEEFRHLLRPAEEGN